MSRYSFSQVQTYIQCPLKYRYKYIEKIKLEEFIETANIILGKIVHSTLEKLYNDVNNQKIPKIEDLIKFYENLRQEKETEAKGQGGEIIINGDFTIEDYKTRGINYIKTYYSKNEPFQNIKVIDTELNFTFNLDKNNTFQCIIDRLDKIGDTFVINDYKTNKKLPPESKESMVEQLTLYGIGIKQQYGKYFKKLKAKLYFLHFDIEDERELSEERLDLILSKYLKIIKEIESKKGSFELGNKKVFEAKQNGLCSYCDYQTMCPLFTYVNSDNEVISDLSDKTLTTLVDEFIEIKTKMSELKKQEESLKALFLQYADLKDPDDQEKYFRLSGTKEDIKITKTPKISVINKEIFLQKMKEFGLFEKYADIARQKVNDIFIKNKELSLLDFQNIVKEDHSFTISKVKKK